LCAPQSWPVQELDVNLSLTISPIHLGNRKFTKITTVLTKPRPIRLKGRSFLALSLAPELPFEDWLTGLDDLAARSAGFFLRRPVVLDVDGHDMPPAMTDGRPASDFERPAEGEADEARDAPAARVTAASASVPVRVTG